MAATFFGGEPPLTNPSGGRQRALGFQSDNGIFVARSDDGGVTWRSPAPVVSNLFDGQHPVFFEVFPDLAIDTFSALPSGKPNPNYGNLYVTWARYYPPGQFPGEPTSTGGSHIMIAASSDGGWTWETRLQPRGANGLLLTPIKDSFDSGIGPPAGLGAAFTPRVTTGPEGDVYVAMSDLGGYSVYRSTDAGKSFVAPDSATGNGLPFGPSQDILPTDSRGLPTNHFRLQATRDIVADPARSGYLYAAALQETADTQGTVLDQANVVFAQSIDHGLTWQQTFQLGGQAARVLNDDNGGQLPRGSIEDVVTGQALPELAVDASGDVALTWYDTRRDPANHRLDVFATSSSDSGQSFRPNVRITDVSFDADAGRFTDPTGQDNFYLGDRIGLAVANGTAFAAWTDTRNGNQDVFFARYPLTQTPPPGTDRFEPNDSPAAATNLGRVVRSHLPKLQIPAGDQDWFRLQTAASGELAVTATPEEAGVAPRLELWDETGTVLLATGTDLRDAAGHVVGGQVRLASPAGRTYLARVLPGPGAAAGGPGRYALDVESLTADLGTQVQGVQAGSLGAGDEAFYRLAAAAAGSLDVTLTSGPDVQGDLNLELLDANDRVVLATGQPSGSPGPGESEHASLAVEPGRVVLLHVMGAAGAHGGFTLGFTNLDQFATPNNRALLFPAGAGPSQVALGDVNGDGKLDIVVTDTLSNTISVLLGNGDGTFQAPRQFPVGAFVPNPASTGVSPLDSRRDIALADVNQDGVLDAVVVNDASGDVSVLLGRGDGTFQPQRRFDATASPFALAVGDFNGDGIPDLVVHDSVPGRGSLAVLLGRGDGTFQPQRLFPSPFADRSLGVSLAAADLNGDGRQDLVLVRFDDPNAHVLLGNGDGTFRAAPDVRGFGPGLAVADLNGDGIPDLVRSEYINDAVSFALGHGDGTFADEQLTIIGQSPLAVAVGDVGSQVTLPDGTTVLGPPDGHPDLIVAASGLAQPALFGPPEVVLLPGLVDAKGRFAGFGSPLHLANATLPQDIKVGDLTGDGVADVVVTDTEGVRVIFGKQPVIAPNDTPQTARNLGTVVHLLEPTLTLVPGHADAYFRLTVPTEAVPGAGDEVLDSSGLFQATEGAGISMEVTDAAGHLLGSGERFRVAARQGEQLTLHVFGLAAPDGSRGAGAYTLDIDTLPQVVSVEAQPLLPGQNGTPGGPTASLVVTLQGDRLDPASAQDPAHYTVTWLGPDGILGGPDNHVIPVVATRGVVYDPSTNVDVASGKTYPTAVRQTVTLVFDQPLPAGSYQVELKPAIQTAPFNEDESALLSAVAGLHGHPVVERDGGQVIEGSRVTAADLVFAEGALGDLGVWQAGTPFLTQLHDDLGALLDAALTKAGDDPAIPGAIDNQILERFAPALGPAGQRPVAVLVIWLDPPSIGLIDPRGQRVVNDLRANAYRNSFRQGFVSVAGNVEVLVLPFAPTAVQSYLLTVADVPPTARGGAVYLGRDGAEVVPLTAGLRGGTTQFRLSFGQAEVALVVPAVPSQGGAQDAVLAAAPPAPAVATGAAAPAVTPAAPTLSPAVALVAVSTRGQTAPVTAIAPRLDAPVAAAPPDLGTAASRASAGSLAAAVAITGGWADAPAGLPDLMRRVRDFLLEVARPLRGIGNRLGALLRGLGARLRGVLQGLDSRLPLGNNGPAPDPGVGNGPPPDLPEEETELPPAEGPAMNGVLQEGAEREADVPLAAVLAVVGAVSGNLADGGGRLTGKKQPASGVPTDAREQDGQG
jgi:hypothetical protein